MAVVQTGPGPSTALFVLGTPHGQWEALGLALRSMAGESRPGRVDPQACRDAAALDALDVDARCIVLVGSPCEAVGHALRVGADVDEALAAWCEGGRNLLRHAQRRPGCCLFIEVAQAWGAPQALKETLARWDAGFADATTSLPPRVAPDAVAHAIGWTAVSQHPSAQRVHAELRARCRGAEGIAPHDAEVEGLATVRDAVAQYRELRVRLDAHERDSAWLGLQLEQAQEELDSTYARLEQKPVRADAGSADARCSAMLVLDHAGAAPHSHLHVDLRQVRVGDSQWHSLEVRLVEHHGRPGLAFFATGRVPEPISAWQPSGQENGRDYMLIVPSDEAGSLLLDRLGSRDWRTVREVTEVLIESLQHIDAGLSERWSRVASRLQRELDARPPRLRYDTMEVRNDVPAGTALEVVLGGVQFAERVLGDVTLRLDARRGEVRWLLPGPGGGVPLARWPAAADGTLASEMVLPAARASAARKIRWWAALPVHDRMVVLGVLDALPSAMGQLLPSTLTDAGTAARAKAIAEALPRDARRRLIQLRLIGAARRRLGGSKRPLRLDRNAHNHGRRAER